jgi:hypothetical protein
MQRLPESEAALRRALALDRASRAATACSPASSPTSSGSTRRCRFSPRARIRQRRLHARLRAVHAQLRRRVSAETLFERHKAFGAELERLHPARFERFDQSRDPERKLRIGFLSGDFHEHPVGWTFAPLIERLDRSRFEATAIRCSTPPTT